MDKNGLLELRKQIVASAREVALKGDGSPASRLQVLLELIRDGEATLEMFQQAFDLSKMQDDDDAKLDMLLDLLFEVDRSVASMDESTEDAGPDRRQLSTDTIAVSTGDDQS